MVEVHDTLWPRSVSRAHPVIATRAAAIDDIDIGNDFAPPPVNTPHRDVCDLVADESCLTRSNVGRPSGTRDWLLILTLAGGGRVCSGETEVICGPGVATLYQPGAAQHYFVDPDAGRWHTLWSHFHPKPAWLFWLRWPEVARGLRSITLRDQRVFENVRSAMLDAVRFSRQRLSGSPDFAANALERAILWIHSVSQHQNLDERIRKAAELMAEQFREPVSLEALSRQCGLSPSRLAHLFKEQLGVAPGQYIESIRLQRAAQLLRSTSLTIGEIAAQTGYVNAFYFSGRFRKEFGKSPSRYRQEKRASNL